MKDIRKPSQRKKWFFMLFMLRLFTEEKNVNAGRYRSIILEC